jgi:spore germination protein YaaH
MELRALKAALALLLVTAFVLLPPGAAGAAAGAANATKYRVYQNDKPLKEFVTESQAIAYAKKYAYSRVEKIADRSWVWHNYPRYAVYVDGVLEPGMLFRTYDEAKRAAAGKIDAAIRDLEKPGWVEANFARYRVYQGHKTFPGWSFATLAEAKKLANRYKNAHIIDLDTNTWIWDNLSEEEEAAEREKAPAYAVLLDGETVGGPYGFLRDAIRAANDIAGSEVVHLGTGAVVHSTVPPYAVFQNGKERKRFFSVREAVAYAKTLAGAEIIRDGKVYWTNIPYYRVWQGEREVWQFHALNDAVANARKLANASIRTEEGKVLWSNASRLLYLGWNGSSNTETILGQIANTQGLDIDSPTWFRLQAADGSLEDLSDPSLAKELKSRGIRVMPLVNNGFDRQMTSAFLADEAAQRRFIDALVKRLAELGVYGVNVDFEEVAAADRSRFTAFVRKLADAVHARGMVISIDLIRGDKAWNHLTAYDQAKLAEAVDYIVIMAYDQYWRGSAKPGSVSGLAWTEQGILDYLSYGIPRSKLLLGVPLYVREWKVNAKGDVIDSRAIFMKDIPALLAEVDAQAIYDPEFGQMKVTYVRNGQTYVFWMETEETIKARIELAKKYDLAGVAFWRLGYEPAELWTTLLRLK